MTFPRYPRYKDSGVEWLGEVPAHWCVAPIGSHYSLRSGYPFSAELFEPEGDPADRLIRIRNIMNPHSRIFTSEPCPEWAIVKDGDVLVGMDGDFNVIYWNAGRAKLNQRVCALRGENESLDRYLFYGLPVPLKITNDLTFSTTVKHLSSGQLLKLRFPRPPSFEVAQIVAFLDHETGKIDALIEEQRRLIDLLKEKRQAVISHAVTKGLDPNVPMKDSGVEWLGEVPVHWTVAALRWYATIQGGLAKGKKYGLDEPVVSRPYLRVANVQDGHFNLSVVHDVAVGLSEVSRYELREGDVLMNEGGDSDKLGRGAVWQGAIEGCLHQNHVFAIRPNRHLSATWLSMFTRSDSARSYFYLYSKQSTNLASISSRNVMACPVPIPPIKEQREILGRLSDALVQIDGLMDETEGAMALLQERRSALISAAVTGKIDVRGWSAAAEEPGLGMVAEESAGYSAQGGTA